MTEEEILSLGFKKNQWTEENQTFTEYWIGDDNAGIEISGTTLVELKIGAKNYITVPNCNSIQELRLLIHLFNIQK